MTGQGDGGARERFGGLVERRRRAAGLTQEQLADSAGVSVAVIRDLEQGRTARPRPGAAGSLARVLRLTDGELAAVTRDGPADPRRAPGDQAAGDQAAGPGGRIRLSVLGSLSASRDGVPVALRGQRSRAVLALLGVQPGCPVSRDAMVDAVWGAAPPATAVNMVQSCVGLLRRLLGPGELGGEGRVLVSCRAGGYVLEATAGQLDLLEFRDLGSRARAAASAGDYGGACELFERAAGLWRGEAVADVAVLRGHPVVAGLARERAALVLEYADAAAQAGGHDRVLEHLRVLAEVDPLDERVHARLMIALAATGQQAAALSVFGELSQRLSDEFGVRPGAEFTEAHLFVLRGGPFSDGQAGAAPPQQLPVRVAHFTGRAGELAVLNALQERAAGNAGTVVISAIGGMAGIGKTALALHWAHQAAGKFPDGQLYVNLRGFDPSGVPAEPQEIIRGFLDALGVRGEQVPHSLEAQAGLYRSLLAGQRMLIVLDNAVGEQQVRPLLPGSPGSLVIVTSRSQLTGLAAREGARLLSLDVLTPAEARDLLVTRLGTARTAREPAAVSQIAEVCAYLPLALAITAGRAAARPRLLLATLAAELRDAHSRLDALDTGDPTASVRAVFSLSYEQLSPGAALMFRLIGLHPGPDISVPAVASLAGVSEPRARHLLTELTRAHLLAEHRPGRYVLHDLLRAYAAEQALATDSDADRCQAIERALDYYLHTAACAADLLSPAQESVVIAPARPGVTPGQPDDYRQALAWLEEEHQVLRAAITLAAESGLDTHAWQISWATSSFLQTRGHYQEWAATQRLALSAATRLGDTAAQALSSRLLATACIELGDHDLALQYFGSSLTLYHQLDDRLGEAKIHHCLGVIAERQARYADALGHAEQALRLYQAIGDKASEATALNNIGMAHGLLGDYQQARAFSRQALTLSEEIGHGWLKGFTWDSLGCAEHHLGNFAEANRCYQRSLSLCREVGDRFSEATTLTHLGDNYQAADDLPRAYDAWQQALAILDDVHHPEAEQLRVKLAAAEPAVHKPTG